MGLNKGQRNLLLLAAIFIVPMLLAYVLVNNMHNLDDFKTKNHGELFNPAKPLQDFELVSVDGAGFKLSGLRGKWVMLYIGTAACDTTCSENLYKMRQSRLAQGGEIKRIKRLYISIDGQPAESLQAVLTEHQGLEVVYGNTPQIEAVLGQFDLTRQDVADERIGIFIVDPLGNLVMRYQTGFEAKGLVKDLSLLLKASYIG
jgi:cytochrome oxidase Cu insertion factor (SCO1/SenC/PrrC family)